MILILYVTLFSSYILYIFMFQCGSADSVRDTRHSRQ